MTDPPKIKQIIDTRAQIAGLLCRELDEATLPWAITHGAEGYPERVGRDFDILLPERFHAQAVALIGEVAGREGWSSCIVPLRWAGAPVFLWKMEGEKLHSFEMHFIDRIDWAGCILAGGTEAGCPPVRVNGLPMATWPGFAKRVLTQVLAGCWDRIGERPEEFRIAPHEAGCMASQMARLFGAGAGGTLHQFIDRGTLQSIKHGAVGYRKKLFLRALTPGSGVGLSLVWLRGKIARVLGLAPWRPPTLILMTPVGWKGDAPRLLSDIIGQLGFAKAKILHTAPPSSATARWRERWKNHIHRSLFRLLAIRFEAGEIHPELIARRLGKGCYGSGTFIATLSHSREDELTCSFHRRGAITAGKETLPSNRIAATIALRYLESMKTMQKQTTHNNPNHKL